MTRQIISPTLLALALCLPASLNAAIIVEQIAPPTATNGNNAFVFGQSLTTPTGGPWNEIQFNFFNANLTPAANGSLFVLTQSYAGLALDLSAATPGFTASSSTITNGVWQFESLILQAETQYFFLMQNAPLPFWGFDTLDIYALGQMYTANSDGYFPLDGQDTTFRLQGNPVAEGEAVPEPGTFALAGAAMLVLLYLRTNSAIRTR